MMKKIIVGNVIAGFIFATGIVGVASALPAKSDVQTPTLYTVQAIEIAKAGVPGLVIKAELDDDDGVQIYEVEIVNADGIEMEVKINAETGEILEAEEDGKMKKKKHKSRS